MPNVLDYQFLFAGNDAVNDAVISNLVATQAIAISEQLCSVSYGVFFKVADCIGNLQLCKTFEVFQNFNCARSEARVEQWRVLQVQHFLDFGPWNQFLAFVLDSVFANGFTV